nr:hypothetical protein GCM10017745_48950 [Saccharothrix mutabilis subsp. capreolus]
MRDIRFDQGVRDGIVRRHAGGGEEVGRRPQGRGSGGHRQGGDFLDEKTGGKFTGQIAQAEDFVAGKVTGDEPDDDAGRARREP